jgi:hypothetical protein
LYMALNLIRRSLDLKTGTIQVQGAAGLSMSTDREGDAIHILTVDDRKFQIEEEAHDKLRDGNRVSVNFYGPTNVSADPEVRSVESIYRHVWKPSRS